jgi:alkanesulfonate monooxygenase SsuD/methylene tetrahydromethanopterin reductase-like flavin-dependent oxidoreductase (luciferase family)
MRIGLFTEFSYPGKSEQQTYNEVFEQILLADGLGYDFFSITESYGKDLFSCSPFPLGIYVAAAQQAKRIHFLTGITSMPVHHPAMLASEVAAADLLTGGRIMVGIGRGHPWVISRLGVNPAESTARFEEGILMLLEIFKGNYIEKLDGEFWQLRDFKLSPAPVQQPHPPIYTAAATTPDSARFAGKVGQGLVQPGYLGIPFNLVRGLTETYRRNLPSPSNRDVVLGIHVHVAGNREQAIENGALALSSQADVFLNGRLSRPVPTEQIQNYATKSASREAFEKLHTPEKARAAVAAEGANIMAVWGTAKDCIEKIKFYVDAVRPEQLMVNIASGSLPQEKVLPSMKLFAEEVMPAVRRF